MSSVYLWDLDHGFAGVILIKKGLKSSINSFSFFFGSLRSWFVPFLLTTIAFHDQLAP